MTTLREQQAYDADAVIANVSEAAEYADFRDPQTGDPVRVRALFGAIDHDVEVSPGGGFWGDVCEAFVPAADLSAFGAGVSPLRHTGATQATLTRYPDEIASAEEWRVLSRRRASPAWWRLDLVRLARPAPRGA